MSLTKGTLYDEEDVMPYLAPDFVDEMLEERHFDRM